mmetsp:Transcript_31211/g.78600  ORF Transcript_31211/g.78600 Transcript_31211/m.78600 type:complete len:216 (-) Transcript_31211:2255-2902(-)
MVLLLHLPRALPHQKLESEHPQRPPVHGRVVRVRRVDELWRHVVRGAQEGPGLAEDEARETHVAELCVPLRIEQNVLKLEISVGDVPVVEVAQREGNARHIEGRRSPPGFVLQQDLQVLGHEHEKVASGRRFHQHVDVRVVFEGPDEANDEGALDHREDVPLCTHLAHEVLLLYVCEGHALQGVGLPWCVVALHEEDSTEGALPELRHGPERGCG